jgi:RNA polymerase sigma factor (sigma-70 family)
VLDEDELTHLVASAQAGDRASLERLLVRLRPTVMRRCSRFLPHHADAEEAAQDALLSISTHLHEYTGRGSFLGWVTVIASNAARSTYRSMRRRAEDSHAVVPDGVDPRTTSVIAGTRLDLMEALAALEERHPALAESFVLRDLGDLTYLQVAEITDAPLGTVKDRIHQALHAGPSRRWPLRRRGFPLSPGISSTAGREVLPCVLGRSSSSWR